MAARTEEPLRLGILGAARIAPSAIVAPAHATGARLVAVAARDTERAKAFAGEHGVERVLSSYEELVADPEVEAVYNPLPNGLHAPWNIRSVRAGKHVLTEKPSASNATEAAAVRDAVDVAGVVFLEGFHYLFHPLMRRVFELLGDGAIGQLRHVEVSLSMAPPPPGDPRWSLALAGGAMMDLGCYSLHAARMLGRFAGGEPRLLGARGGDRDGTGVDEWLDVDLEYPSGVTASARCSMLDSDYRFRLTVLGSAGRIETPMLLGPTGDRALIVATRTGSFAESFGPTSTYTYQLAAFAARVRGGAPLPIGADDAVVQMALVDAAFGAAGLPVRPVTAL